MAKKTTKKKKREFTITANAEQVRVMMDALELYSRLYCGQVNEIIYKNPGAEHYYKNKEAIANSIEILSNLKKMLFPELAQNASYGVGQKELPTMAWDIYQVLRYAYFQDDKEKERFLVIYDKPLKFGTEPLATVERKWK